MDVSNKAEKRREQIRAMLISNTVVSLGEFCARLACSESTIRNDLKYLEDKGLITRTYGGAAINESTKFNIPMNTRSRMHMEEKRDIARYIAQRIIAPGSTVTLDSGTTNVEIAKEILESSMQLTVITTSFAIASVLSKTDNIALFLAGGRLHQVKDAFIDQTAIGFVSSMRSDLYILSCDGVDANAGFTIADPEEAYIKQIMSKSSRRTICAVDSSKLGEVYIKIICKLDDVDMLVTDSRAREKQLHVLREAGLNVTVAESAPGPRPAQGE